MQHRLPTLLAPLLAGLMLGACAQTPAEHEQHHPGSPPVAASSGPAAAPNPQGMERQMQAMQAMQARMAAAQTPAERQALMAEHGKVMQDSMAMMRGMGGMQGMGGMGSAGAAPEMGQRLQMMEKRMEMMQSMMQMMMDRLPPPAPGKP